MHLSQRLKLRLRVSGGKHKTSLEDLVPRVLQRLKCVHKTQVPGGPGRCTKSGENSNRESWGLSQYVLGIKVRTTLVKFLRKHSSRLIRLPLLTGSRRQVVREE